MILPPKRYCYVEVDILFSKSFSWHRICLSTSARLYDYWTFHSTELELGGPDMLNARLQWWDHPLSSTLLSRLDRNRASHFMRVSMWLSSLPGKSKLSEFSLHNLLTSSQFLSVPNKVSTLVLFYIRENRRTVHFWGLRWRHMVSEEWVKTFEIPLKPLRGPILLDQDIVGVVKKILEDKDKKGKTCHLTKGKGGKTHYPQAFTRHSPILQE